MCCFIYIFFKFFYFFFTNQLCNAIRERTPGCLGTWLVLLFLVEGKKGHGCNLNNLESDTGDITNGVTLTTETGNEDFVVFVDKVKATVVWDEGGNLLTVLDELHTDACFQT